MSVCLSHISHTEPLFVLKTLSRIQRATKVKIFVGICLKRLHSRVMPRNMSEKANMLIIQTYSRSAFSAGHTAKRQVTQRLSTTFSLCPKRYLLMPLARVGARTDSSTTRSANRGTWLISAHAHWHSARLNAVCAEGFAL